VTGSTRDKSVAIFNQKAAIAPMFPRVSSFLKCCYGHRRCMYLTPRLRGYMGRCNLERSRWSR